MTRTIRIGNACAFWGDRLAAAVELLKLEPDLDVLTLDFLAEISMSLLAIQQSRTGCGYPRDVLEVVRSLAPYWRAGGRCKLITNAGGLAPHQCAVDCKRILKDAGAGHLAIGVVTGDDVLAIVRSDVDADRRAALFPNLDTGMPMHQVVDRLLSANAYVGAAPIVEAFEQGADLVITGRVADPSLTLAACIQHFHWSFDDFDRLAGGTIAGHLIECGTQVTGGIYTDWMQVGAVSQIGFPIVEMSADGSCVVTKAPNTGGLVSPAVVKEQLVYEIGDPACYISPDVCVSLLSISLDAVGADRVRVRGARGMAPPPHLKVSATYSDGFRAAASLLVAGPRPTAKAHKAADAVLGRLRDSGIVFREAIVECLGAGDCWPSAGWPRLGELPEVVLRVAVADDNESAVRQFTREMIPLVTAGPQGTTGYAEGRPRVHPMFRFWPCLIERNRVHPIVELIPGDAVLHSQDDVDSPSAVPARNKDAEATERDAGLLNPCNQPESAVFSPTRLLDIAHGRSGDKGDSANIGILARDDVYFERLRRELTAARVADYFGLDPNRVVRYELPNLAALNFVLRGVLSNPLRSDAQGKALAQVLLEMPLDALKPKTGQTTPSVQTETQQ